MKKILIVEDDLSLQLLLKGTFKALYHCESARTLAGAYRQLENKSFDLVIIDRGLPDGDGVELLEYLTDLSYKTKLLALTSRSQLPDRLEGLELGADEYLAKPFALAELKLRVEKLLKLDKKRNPELLQAGPLEFCPETGVVKLNSREVNLRPRETEILHCLLRYKNQVVTRKAIIDDVWAGESIYPAATTLDVYIRRIRVMLQEYSTMISTIRGFGYKFTDL